MNSLLSSQKRKTEKFKWYQSVDTAAILSFVLVSLYFLVLYSTGKMCISYDSCNARAIVSGDLSGQPNPHILLLNYTLGFIMAILYKTFPLLNWFSLLLLFTIYFGLWSLLYRIMMLAGYNKVFKQCIIGVFAIFFFDFFFYSDIMGIYYHNCALIVALAAFFYLLTIDELKLKDMLISLTLLVLCLGIRFSLFKELSPFLALVCFIRYFVFRRRKNLILLLIILITTTGFMWIVDHNAYKGKYAHEREMNQHRATIQDYQRWLSYEGHEVFFESLGMDKDDYDVMKDCWGMSDHFNKETLVAIADTYKKEYESTPQRLYYAKYLLEQMVVNDYVPAFWLLEIFSVTACLILLSKRRDRKFLHCFFGMFLFAVGEIVYLAYRGRLPVRVTLMPLLVLMLTGIAYLVLYKEDLKIICQKSTRFRIMGIVSVVIVLLCTIYASHNMHDSFDEEYSNQTSKELSMISYILNDREHFYLLHNFYGMHDTLDICQPQKRNWMGWGGWISETVDWKEKLQGEYDTLWDALAYREDLRLVMYDGENSIQILLSYLNHHGYACSAESETIVVDEAGSSYEVWRIISTK